MSLVLKLISLIILSTTQSIHSFENADVVSSDAATEIPAQNHPLHKFTVDDNSFKLDGKELLLVGGSMQYFRIPKQHWEHRLMMMKEAGFNTLFMSIEWSTHEPLPGSFKFTGDEDFMLFIRIAEQLGLKVVVRSGPFIGEERDFGGYPPWLLWHLPRANLSLAEPGFKKRVIIYMNELLPRLKPLLASHGGPVIMIEITPEASKCDWMMQLFRDFLGYSVLFRTHDETNGAIKSSSTLISATNEAQNASLVTYTNSWSNIWNRDYWTTVRILSDSLAAGKSLGIGAFHAGTDFGFKAGLAEKGNSYALFSTEHMDAPLGEDGYPRPIYMELHRIACSYFGIDLYKPLVHPGMMTLDTVTLWPVGSLLEASNIKKLATCNRTQNKPATFEDLQQGSGFVLYETTIKDTFRDATIYLHSLRDRAQVYVDGDLKGVVFRTDVQEMTVFLGNLTEGSLLQIFVENQGRLYWRLETAESNLNKKGLAVDSVVVIGVKLIEDWRMYCFPLNDSSKIHDLVTSQVAGFIQDDVTKGTPLLAGVDFEIDMERQDIKDTFLDMRGWGHGVVFLNGHNLGRYWPDAGSRKGLYVPSQFLLPRSEINHLAILELERLPRDKCIMFRITLEGYSWLPMYNVIFGMLFMMLCLSILFYFGQTIKKWTYERAGVPKVMSQQRVVTQSGNAI